MFGTVLLSIALAALVLAMIVDRQRQLAGATPSWAGMWLLNWTLLSFVVSALIREVLL